MMLGISSHVYSCVCVCVCIYAVLCLVAQSCLTLCDPMDCSSPGSSVHGVLPPPLIRILEWGTMISSRIFPTLESNPCLLGLLHWQASSLSLMPPRSPNYTPIIIIKNLWVVLRPWGLGFLSIVSTFAFSSKILFAVSGPQASPPAEAFE